MNAKDFERVATVCEPTLSRMCRNFMPYHNASDYSVNSDMYYALIDTLNDVTEYAMRFTTIDAFISHILKERERAKLFRDIYYRDMHFIYESAHDYEYYKVRTHILRSVLSALKYIA